MGRRFKAEPYIRYANCYEDAETLLEVIGGAKKALSIASGGDNSLALLTAPGIDRLVVFDRNPAQLYITKLKFAAFGSLAYDEFLVLLGVRQGDPSAVYNKIRPCLDAGARDYFDARPGIINKIKLVNSGKFEYYLNLMRKYAVNLTQSRKTVREFMSFEGANGQKEFYLEKINNRRWRLIIKKFFDPENISKRGRDKESFKYAGGNIYEKITGRLMLCFDNVPNKENHFLQYFAYGRFESLPFYLRKENFDTIKANIRKAVFVLGDIKTVARLKEKFDFFNLSDIFEYMSEEETAKNEDMISEMAETGAKAVFWNMIVDRQFRAPSFISADNETVYDIYKKEKAYYYQALRIYKKA